MRIELARQPYSRAGSHLVVDRSDAGEAPEYRICTRFKGGLETLLFAFPAANLEMDCHPGGLACRTSAGVLKLVFPDAWHLRMGWRGTFTLQTQFTAPNVVRLTGNSWILFGWKQGLVLRLFLRSGSIRLLPDSKVADCREPATLVLESEGGAGDLLIAYGTREPSLNADLLEESIDLQSQRVEQEFITFRDAFAACPERFAEAREAAAFILWSTLRAPLGCITRTASVMSNHWMTHIWNWDNYFNALALAPTHPALAAEAFSLFFDHISPEGQLPDYINQAQVSYIRTKPPVQGRFLILMLRSGFDPGSEWLADMYHKMAHQARWWTAQRTLAPGQSPAYFFPSESGWDNATCLKGYCPAISPDLAAIFLAYLHALATIAERLGYASERATWLDQAASIRRFIESALCADGIPRLLDAGLHPIHPPGQSLLPFVSLHAGDLIDPALFSALLDALRNASFASPAGLASEATDSPRFIEDGYWSGAAWAPPALLIADGARRAGHPHFASRIAAAFCSNAVRHGFPENYSALSGAPLRDPHYSWSAAAFLSFLRLFPAF